MCMSTYLQKRQEHQIRRAEEQNDLLVEAAYIESLLQRSICGMHAS